MKNIKIIFVLAAAFISVFVIKAVGKEKFFFQMANTKDNVILQSANNAVDSLGQTSPEIFSKNEADISSDFLTNMKCGNELQLSANLALARFLNNNNKVYEFNPDNYWPIASITKLMTAVVVKENIDPLKSVTFADKEILGQNSVENFKTGEIYKAGDLLKAMLLLSSNDAAEALADNLPDDLSAGFSRDKFIYLMNKKAKDLDLDETVFFDPTGLSAKNQSTPNDILKMISYIHQNYPEILKITSQKSSPIVELNSKRKRNLSNINEFAGQLDFIGGKTGFIDEAQGNLVSLFSLKKEPVAIVVLGSQDRFGDTRKLFDCVKNSDVSPTENIID